MTTIAITINERLSATDIISGTSDISGGRRDNSHGNEMSAPKAYKFTEWFWPPNDSQA